MQVTPFGLNPLYDIKHILNDYTINVIVDVGANVGQSADKFVTTFPEAIVHCLEPISETYSSLKRNTARYKNVVCHNLALGSKNESVEISLEDNIKSTRVSLRPTMVNSSNVRTEKVEVKTLSTFCSTFKIARIDYLKIDTEGYDLEVLKGGEEMLTSKQIDLIEVEAGMNPTNTYHVNFSIITKYLEDNGYYIFGIYEQSQEWLLNKPILRRCNLLFISHRLAETIKNNNSNFNRIDKFNF
jgi:FkbM family methyltransferase